jgi:hypothetical protein
MLPGTSCQVWVVKFHTQSAFANTNSCNYITDANYKDAGAHHNNLSLRQTNDLKQSALSFTIHHPSDERTK